jgi:hypothetical protein
VKVDDGESTPSENHELSLGFQQLFETWFRIAVFTTASWFIAGFVTRCMLAGPFRRFDFWWLVGWTGDGFGAMFVIVVCSAVVALLLSTIVYLLSRRRVNFFWGFSITRDIGAAFGAIVGGIAGVVTVLAGK